MKKTLENLGLTESQAKEILLRRKRRKPKILKRNISDDVLKFGVVSDTHLCSIHEKLDELHTFYAICEKAEVQAILHAGDLLSGFGIYKGQENEVHTFGAKKQVAYAAKNYPQIEGIKTYFIDGNHDESWFKRAGVETGEMLGEMREDMVYLGQYQGDLELSGVHIRLHHPDGGGAYALSYKGQKLVEQMPSGKKPRVFIMGHYHTAFYFWYRNMHVFNAGCFEGQSLFLLRKGLNPAIGGWIITLTLGKRKNDVLSCRPSWIPFT